MPIALVAALGSVVPSSPIGHGERSIDGGLAATPMATVPPFTEVVAPRGASLLSMNNYPVPVFGVLRGVLFLGESPGADAVSAFAPVLIGVVVSQGGGRAPVRAPVPGGGPDRPS